MVAGYSDVLGSWHQLGIVPYAYTKTLNSSYFNVSIVAFDADKSNFSYPLDLATTEQSTSILITVLYSEDSAAIKLSRVVYDTKNPKIVFLNYITSRLQAVIYFDSVMKILGQKDSYVIENPSLITNLADIFICPNAESINSTNLTTLNASCFHEYIQVENYFTSQLNFQQCNHIIICI